MVITICIYRYWTQLLNEQQLSPLLRTCTTLATFDPLDPFWLGLGKYMSIYSTNMM